VRKHVIAFAIGVVVLSACGTEPGIGGGDDDSSTPPYAEIPSEPQRAGDPAKGYDYLLNGGYVTCGLPRSIAPGGSAADRIPGRTGDNVGLPYYWSAATSMEGVRVVSANCLMCHAGRINGQIVVGLGAADVDFTKSQLTLVNAAGGLLSDPNEIAEWMRFRDRLAAIDDWQKTLTVGTNPADSFTAVLMAHRDPKTLAWSAEPLVELPPKIVIPVDTPPWWRMSKKHAMFYTAAGRGDHARIMMAASLLCTESVEEATKIDQAFVDVRAWIEEGLTAPKWPWSVDMALAGRGETVFEATCSKCHGTYGEGGKYFNQLVPLADVGTDPLLATGETEFAARYVEWFAESFWGELSRMEPQAGYIAPPLDGIWATAPYFHNGSVPTLAAVLDPSSRPKYWTRTMESTDYSLEMVGWNHTVLDHGQAAEPTFNARVKIYDTTLSGYGNGGHEFAAELSNADKLALLEYLKTL
jgi:cytochrome c5